MFQTGKLAPTAIAGQKWLVYTSLAAAKEGNSVIFLPIAIYLCYLEMPKLQKDHKGRTPHRVWGEAGFLVTLNRKQKRGMFRF